MSLSSLQRRVDRTVRLYRALMILIGGLPAHLRREVDEQLASIPHLSNRVLETMEADHIGIIRRLGDDLGFISTPDEYIQIVETAMENPRDLYFLPKEFIRTRLFRNFEIAAPRWALHPPHSRFG